MREKQAEEEKKTNGDKPQAFTPATKPLAEMSLAEQLQYHKKIMQEKAEAKRKAEAEGLFTEEEVKKDTPEAFAPPTSPWTEMTMVEQLNYQTKIMLEKAEAKRKAEAEGLFTEEDA